MDERDMFPEAVRAVRELQPKAFIFENVKGLMRESFSSYFEYIHLQLTHPSLTRRKGESWADHRVRLEKHHTSRQVKSEYNVVYRLLNAADFGVPQRRERIFLVGFRSDLGAQWSFPEGTNSEDALLRSKWITGEYWQDHAVAKRHRPTLEPRHASRVERLKTGDLFADQKSPWLTVRDAIRDLPDPEKFPNNATPNHTFNPGVAARRNRQH